MTDLRAALAANGKKKFWVSWYATPDIEFELHSPWWVSGWRLEDDAATICAALLADDENDARGLVREAYRVINGAEPPEIEFRFVNARRNDWSPFCDRFPRADWMKWEDAAHD